MKKKLKLRIPESLSEITLDQYQTWVKIATTESNKDTYFLKQKTIEILCKVPLKFVATITHKNVDKIFNELSIMLSGIDQLENTDREKIIIIDGVEYGFIPDFENLSSGEYADLEARVTDFSEWHNAMAIMYRPITLKLKDKYMIKDYEGIENEWLMKRIPADKAIKAVFFLINCLAILEKSLEGYLKEELHRTPALNKTFNNVMGGTMPSLQLLSTTLRSWMKSPNLMLGRSSHTSSTVKTKVK